MRTLKILLNGCENRNRWFSQHSENRPTLVETVRRGRPKWNYAKLNQCFFFGGKILQQSWLQVVVFLKNGKIMKNDVLEGFFVFFRHFRNFL
jgi:hypothetical protein